MALQGDGIQDMLPQMGCLGISIISSRSVGKWQVVLLVWWSRSQPLLGEAPGLCSGGGSPCVPEAGGSWGVGGGGAVSHKEKLSPKNHLRRVLASLTY